MVPIKPAGWSLDIVDGKPTVCPSVGNREFECRSHYYIRGGEVVWLRKMSDLDRDFSRAADIAHRARVYRIPWWRRVLRRILGPFRPKQ